MTNQIKNFIEEGEKEFEEKFGDPMKKKYGKGFVLYCTNCNGKSYDDIKQFISSRQISLIKMIVEMCEDEKRELKQDCNECLSCESGMSNCDVRDQDRQFNKALDTISSKLKTLTDGK